jgi:hypothetical protein
MGKRTDGVLNFLLDKSKAQRATFLEFEKYEKTASCHFLKGFRAYPGNVNQ